MYCIDHAKARDLVALLLRKSDVLMAQTADKDVEGSYQVRLVTTLPHLRRACGAGGGVRHGPSRMTTSVSTQEPVGGLDSFWA